MIALAGKKMNRVALAASCLALLSTAPVAADEQATTSFKFQFGPGKVAAGYTPITPETTYSKERGYGFEPGPELKALESVGAPPLVVTEEQADIALDVLEECIKIVGEQQPKRSSQGQPVGS